MNDFDLKSPYMTAAALFRMKRYIHAQLSTRNRHLTSVSFLNINCVSSLAHCEAKVFMANASKSQSFEDKVQFGM